MHSEEVRKVFEFKRKAQKAVGTHVRLEVEATSDAQCVEALKKSFAMQACFDSGRLGVPVELGGDWWGVVVVVGGKGVMAARRS